MGLHLKYARRDGSEHKYEIKSLDTEIFLEYLGITEISLDPLRSMKRLRKLSLQDNHIETLNLTPLSSCTSLREISIGGNQLERVDLTPLRDLRNLSVLRLNENNLQNVNLIPLSSCKRLKYLNLAKNQINSQNLTPLSSTRDLRLLMDKDTKTSTLLSEQTMSLSFFKSLKKNVTNFDDLHPIEDMQLIVDIYPTIKKHEPLWKSYHLFYNAMMALNLEWLGLPDLKAGKMMKEISSWHRSIDKTEHLRESIISQVCKKIDKNIIPLLLDTKRIMPDAELAKRLPIIIEQRNKEIENLNIHVSNDFVDLKPMWLTTYGQEVLAALSLGTECGLDDFEKVKNAFSNLGFQLRISSGPNPSNPSIISKPLQDYIWKFVEYTTISKIPKDFVSN